MVINARLVLMTVDISLPPDCPPGPLQAPIPRADRIRAEQVAGIARLLADPIRVQLLDQLRAAGEPVCQCNLQPLFPVSQPTLSHHLRKLSDAGVVRVERRGRWAFYELDQRALGTLRAWLAR
ncbi:MAG: metalloregulator ArsR/SmtB family transcription factor [Solirubrobacteraceae bacterium]